MSTYKALYFPYFHFPNDAWIKVAALYWDKMYRIVPWDVPTRRDTASVRALATGSDSFIENVHPEEYWDDKNTVAVAFAKLIENNTNELVKHYGVENRNRWPAN